MPPRLVGRDGWGARPPRSRSTIPTPSAELWLHHTAGSESGAAGMRAIQRFHMDSRQWSDIGYSWVYCPDTRTWFEGRGDGVAGAHTSGHNSSGHGLCVMGNFDVEPVTSQIVADVAWMVARGARSGVWPAAFTGGHRDVGSTSCPGRRLYDRIGDINVLAEGPLMGFTEHEQKVLKDLVAALDKVGSNGWFAEQAVKHLRDHPSSTGAHDHDGRYAPKGHGHTGTVELS